MRRPGRDGRGAPPLRGARTVQPSESGIPPASAPTAVEFELTPEDWVEVSMEHAWRSKHLKDARRTIRFLLVAIFAVLALLFSLQGFTVLAWTVILAGGTLVAVLDPLLRSSQRGQLARVAAMGLANGTFGRHRVELRPEGMLDATDGYEWLTRWRAIDRVEEGEGAFLIYTGPNALLPIPHSAFRDGASLREFSEAFYRLRSRNEGGALPPSRP
jgi:hypothetical protein